MADRNSAAIFSLIFQHLAEDIREHAYQATDGQNDNPPRAAAIKFWQASWQYDFSPEQLDCDEDLIKLGLARRCTDQFGDEAIEYRDSDAKKWRGL